MKWIYGLIGLMLLFGMSFAVDWALLGYHYKIPFNITVSENNTDTAYFITLNTTKYVSSGMMKPDCSDIRLLINGTEVPVWIDGCGSSNTKIWMKLNWTVGTYPGEIYFGGASVSHDPTKIFKEWDSFESCSGWYLHQGVGSISCGKNGMVLSSSGEKANGRNDVVYAWRDEAVQPGYAYEFLLSIPIESNMWAGAGRYKDSYNWFMIDSNSGTRVDEDGYYYGWWEVWDTNLGIPEKTTWVGFTGGDSASTTKFWYGDVEGSSPTWGVDYTTWIYPVVGLRTTTTSARFVSVHAFRVRRVFSGMVTVNYGDLQIRKNDITAYYPDAYRTIYTENYDTNVTFVFSMKPTTNDINCSLVIDGKSYENFTAQNQTYQMTETLMLGTHWYKISCNSGDSTQVTVFSIVKPSGGTVSTSENTMSGGIAQLGSPTYSYCADKHHLVQVWKITQDGVLHTIQKQQECQLGCEDRNGTAYCTYSLVASIPPWVYLMVLFISMSGILVMTFPKRLIWR